MIELVFSGDFAPILDPSEIREDHFSEITDILSSAQVHITNLECPITNNNIPIEKSGPSIKTTPDAISLLKQAKVSIACLANNHIFDFGDLGLNETLELCHKNGVDTIGIVSRPDGRNHWLIKEIEGKKIGFINYCEHEFSVREQGLIGACGFSSINAFYDISTIKPLVDFLVVIYHGGNEYYSLPNPDLKKVFQYLADLGADTVIGHHTHVYSGYEDYKGKPLVYSLGNFFFPYPNEPEEWHYGMLCQLQISGKIEIKFIPFIQCLNGDRVTFPSTEKERDFNKRLAELSGIIINNEALKIHWEQFVKIQGRGLSHFFIYSTRIARLLYKLPYLKFFIKRKKRRIIIRNIIKCTSLQKLLIDNLEYNDSRNS